MKMTLCRQIHTGRKPYDNWGLEWRRSRYCQQTIRSCKRQRILLQVSWDHVFVNTSIFHFYSPEPEKAMATHSSTLAWKIPWTEEPGRLQSMGSQRVGHDWATSLSLFTFHALEKEMATHSSVLAWRISGMGEPGGLPSMGSHRVRHNWSNLVAAAAVSRTVRQ